MTLLTEIPDCPLKTSADEALLSARDLSRQMKRLSRLMRSCRTCSLWQGESQCPLMSEINAQVEIVIAEVLQSWNLAPAKPEVESRDP